MIFIFQNRNLGVLFSIVFLFFLNETMLFPTLPIYLKGFGYTNAEIGMTLGAFALGVLTLRPVSASVTDRRGRRPSILMGLLIFTIAPFFYFFSHNFFYIIAVRFFHGMGITFFTTAYPAMVSDIAPLHRRGEIMGHMGVASSVSVAIGPFTGTLLLNTLGMMSVFFSCIVIGLISLGMMMFMTETASLKVNSKKKTITFLTLLKRRVIAVTSFTALVMALINGSIITFLPIMIKDETRLSTSVYFTILSCMMIGFRLFSSKLSDHYGRGPCFFYSFLCMIAGTVMVSRIHTFPILVLAASLHGMGIALALPSLMALLTDFSEETARGSVFGIFFGAYDLGMILAGVILGALSDHMGIRNMYLFAATMGAAAALLFSLLIRPDIRRSLRWTVKGECHAMAHSPYTKK